MEETKSLETYRIHLKVLTFVTVIYNVYAFAHNYIQGLS